MLVKGVVATQLVARRHAARLRLRHVDHQARRGSVVVRFVCLVVDKRCAVLRFGMFKLSQLTIGVELGRGAYGIVNRVKWRGA
jgi:hypothetical protein